MAAILTRNYKLFLFTALALLGLAIGHLGASVAGMRLATPGATTAAEPKKRTAPVARTLRLADYEPIVQRSLFAPDLAGKLSLLGGDEKTAAPPRANLTLLGTIAGGPHPLALTRIDAETKVLHIGETLADGGRVIEIARQLLKLRYPDGSVQSITPPEVPLGEAGGTGETTGIRPASGNRFAISRSEADKARANLGELLKQARMEPYLVNGKTEGFVVKMLRPNTIFTALGLQRGDIVKQVNGLPLDSPEKALQIFQQLREARHVAIALERNGSPMNLEYDLE